MEDTEVIRQQMSDTRASLSDKLGALEQQVMSTVHETTQSVTETVDTVKDAVESTVTTVTDSVQDTIGSVQEAFNLSRQFEQHPWLMMAGAVGVGYLGSRLLMPAEEQASRSISSHSYRPAQPAQPALTPPAPAPTPSSGQSTLGGLAGSLSESLGPPLNKLKGLAIGTMTGVLGNMLLQSVPGTLRDQVTEVIDQFTTSLGGKPVHGLLGEESSQDQGSPHRPSDPYASGR